MSLKPEKHSSKKTSRRHGKRKTSGQRSGSMKIERFSQRNKVPRSTLYDLWEQGLGPRVMRRGRLVRISYQAECDWIKQMEAQEAAVVPPLADVKAESSEEGDASEAIEASDETDEQDEESEASDETRMPNSPLLKSRFDHAGRR
jgi:hypothetical protein